MAKGGPLIRESQLDKHQQYPQPVSESINVMTSLLAHATMRITTIHISMFWPYLQQYPSFDQARTTGDSGVALRKAVM